MSNPIEEVRLIPAFGPETNNSSQVGQYVSMKNVNKAYCVIIVNNGVTEGTMTVTPYQATAVAGTSAKVFASSSLNIWACLTCTSDETLTKQTAAGNYTFDLTSTGRKMAIIEIPVGQFDIGSSFDCLGIQVTATTSSNRVAAFYQLEMRYKEADTPAVITD